ncbi:SRPBCC family protein [Mesonia sp.]|uniref:SRPBCC family protein n=1 Tax=Mesonia sp. TaxID=1960830 RepID=UPI00176187A3|nr:SRPBCC family protein [Mesonia sp.]HIB36191.1 cell division protein [Mesonia sp.]HIO26914.1 cell division protein [Flavobacteriaceae bacterium]
MPIIRLKTTINAPQERVFNLSRSLDLHIASAAKTKEKVISVKQTGLLELNEEVTWRAKHLGVYQNLTSKITQFNFPYSFADEMQKGAFKSFSHQHLFKKISEQQTQLIDVFEYESPLGILGKLADKLFLKSYMKRFLQERNQVIKTIAESDNYQRYLPC